MKNPSQCRICWQSLGHVASRIFFMAVSTTGSVTESQDTEGMRPTQPAPVIYLNCSENVFKLNIYYYYIYIIFTQTNVLNFNKQVLVFHPEILL